MHTTVTLDERHFKLAADKARAMESAEQYLQALIDADSRSFDEILMPVRKGFESIDDADLDGLLDRARRAPRQSE